MIEISKEDLQEIIDCLEMAYEHLEYCGWGDNWERECAIHNKMPEQIEKSIQIGQNILKMG